MGIPVTRDTVGPIIAVVVAAVCAVNATLAFDGFGRLIPALLGAVAVFAAVPLVGAFGGRVAGGRFVQVRGHAHGSGTRQLIATHEAGHAVAARAVGGRVRSAVVYPGGHGGLVQATVPDARAELVFLLAGAAAAGTRRGAGADEAAARRTLREFPREERGQVWRDAQRDTRRIVTGRRGEIRRDAAELDSKGHL